MSNVFGPVPSRRLGRSLGVDVVPFKTCSYDCIYCQIGRTDCLSVERKDWLPVDQLIGDLLEKLPTQPDYITISGSGEPTLYASMGELIDRIKALTAIPVAVLTNGSLLWQKEVRNQLAHADLIVPSLDAGCAISFQAANRPHKSITFEKMLSGLIALRQEFKGEYWLEILLLGGLTGNCSEVEKLVQCVEQIKPDRVQLNTVMRPPAENFAQAITKEQLELFSAMFTPNAEIIADFSHIHKQSGAVGDRTEILNLLQRRPCSVEDIASGLSLHRNEIVKHLEELSCQQKIEQMPVNNTVFYKVKENQEQTSNTNT